MVRRWKQAGFAILISASLAAASGCQAVNGVDIGSALEKEVTTTSVEASGSLSLQLMPGKGKFASQEEEAVSRILDGAKLELKHVALQDPTHESVEGVLTYEKVSIPFQVEIDGQRIIVQLDGGKKPIVFSKTESDLAFPSVSAMLAKEFQTKSVELVKVFTHFAVKNAPNPTKLDVSAVTDTVYGEQLDLQKVHVELSGSELRELVKKFLKSIAADDQGMKELLGQLYDLLAPLLKQTIQAQMDEMKGMDEGEDIGIGSGLKDMFSLYLAYLDNKTLTVEFLYTTIKQYLDKALKEMDNPSDTASQSEYSEDVLPLFSDSLTVKLDWLLDNSLNVRKEHIELSIPTGDAALEPVAGIRLVGDMELWNHGKPVSAARIPTGDGTLEVGGLEGVNNDEVLANFAPGSAMYKLLKDELHITRQQMNLNFTSNDKYDKYESYFPHPYITENGIAMVPVRLISERFGAVVTWDEEMQSVLIKDARSGADISLQLGSSTAMLNGKQVELASPAISKNGKTYVPLRFIADAFGAKLEWNDATNTVSVARE